MFVEISFAKELSYRDLRKKIKQLRSEQKFEEAIPYIKMKAEMMAKRHGFDSLYHTDSLISLSDFYYKSGKFRESENTLTRVLKVYEVFKNKSSFFSYGVEVCKLANDLALKQRAGLIDKFYKKCILAQEEELGAKHSQLSLYYNSYGEYLAQLKKYDEARIYFQKAVDVASPVAKGMPILSFSSLLNLSYIELQLHNTPAAEEACLKILKTPIDTLGVFNFSEIIATIRLAVIYSRDKKRQKEYQALISKLSESKENLSLLSEALLISDERALLKKILDS